MELIVFQLSRLHFRREVKTILTKLPPMKVYPFAIRSVQLTFDRFALKICTINFSNSCHAE